MDVPAALNARGYESDGMVSFEVTDPTRPGTSGTYRLEASGGAGLCERVGAGADVSMDIDVLGHLYLGGGNALAMAAAGRIEGDPAAVRALHRLFRADPAPWCPEVF
jgi:predicted acetyltransferase